jgi:HEPN domain-containing protein
LPRKTDSNNPADWLWVAASDLEGVRELAGRELSDSLCRGKLAEILEKVVKAELIRLGWRLEKTHDLNRLALALRSYGSPSETAATPLCQALAEVYFTNALPRLRSRRSQLAGAARTREAGCRIVGRRAGPPHTA